MTFSVCSVGIELPRESKGPSLSKDILTLTMEDDSYNYFKLGLPYRGGVIVKQIYIISLFLSVL